MYKKDGGLKDVKLLLGLTFLFLTAIWLIPAALSVQNDTNTEIEYLKAMIIDSPDECWRKPAQNRKSTMYSKVETLESLVLGGYLEEAYDKLRRDIKPKLTGLKADENDMEWANGIFKNSWVQCTDLMEEFRSVCDSLLMKLNPLYIDDETPPTIDVNYEGEATEDEPGTWIVYIEDLESGLSQVEILLNGEIEIYEDNLFGINSALYLIDLPAIEGTYILLVTATNNDLTPDIASISASIDIQPGGPGGGPIIIG